MTDKSETKKSEREEVKNKEPIFTQYEVENTVKAFILAFLNNRIIIDFPTSEEIKDNLKNIRPKMTDKQAEMESAEEKMRFGNNIQICCGTVDATEEERKHAVQDLFEQILLLRTNHRIDGSFEDYDLMKKINEFEEKLNATNKVIAELVKWLVDTERGMNGNLS